MGAIIDPRELTPLSGGVRAGIIRMDTANPVHRRALIQTIYGETLVHGEGLFDESSFGRVIKAADADKLRGYFLVVSLELCDPKFAGAAIQIKNAILKRKGLHVVAEPGEHGEDTALCQSLSEIIRDLTKNENCPDGVRLGTWFTKERVRLSMTDPAFMPYGMVSGGRTAEHWIDNVPITKLYKKFNTTLGTHETPILTLNGLTPEMEDRARRLRVPVDLENLGNHSNIFLTRWTEGEKEFALGFNESISTFRGHPVVRVNAKSNGASINPEVLKDALASSFFVGGQEVSERRWDTGNVYNAFGGKVPVMLIHAPGEKQIVDALRDMGAQDRRLGGKLMVPSVMDFDNLPENMKCATAEPIRPFKVVNPATAANDPHFDIGKAA